MSKKDIITPEFRMTAQVVEFLDKIVESLNIKNCETYKQWIETVVSVNDFYYILEEIQKRNQLLESCVAINTVTDIVKQDIEHQISETLDKIKYHCLIIER